SSPNCITSSSGLGISGVCGGIFARLSEHLRENRNPHNRSTTLESKTPVVSCLGTVHFVSFSVSPSFAFVYITDEPVVCFLKFLQRLVFRCAIHTLIDTESRRGGCFVDLVELRGLASSSI